MTKKKTATKGKRKSPDVMVLRPTHRGADEPGALTRKPKKK